MARERSTGASRAAVGHVIGDLQVEGQGGEVVADQVVQVARDPQALALAGGRLEQRPGAAQLGVGEGEASTQLALGEQRDGGGEREDLEPAVRDGLNARRQRVGCDAQVLSSTTSRLCGDQRVRDARADDVRGQRRGEDEQHGREAELRERCDRDRGGQGGDEEEPGGRAFEPLAGPRSGDGKKATVNTTSAPR
jgi:hypothetical protein